MEGGSPYDRHTYRYTPIIAYLMIPNLYYEAFGKIMFSIIDLLTCLIMKKFINSTFLLNLWIFNPLTIQVSTRGSSDTLVVFLIYWMLYLIKKENYTLSALIYGFVVHLRIYPIIYCLPLYFFIDNLNQEKMYIYLYYPLNQIWPNLQQKQNKVYNYFSISIFNFVSTLSSNIS